MLNTTQGIRGMAVAPHSLAAQSALSVLRDGGNAIEAMVAAASTIAVVYPHMNGIGGDGFWLIAKPDLQVVAIEACGSAGADVSVNFYQNNGCSEIPVRGPLAANTVAGTVDGWDVALSISTAIGGKLPLSRLLDDAIYYAKTGFPVTVSQYESTRRKLIELNNQSGFSETFLVNGNLPEINSLFFQPRLGETLKVLAREGLRSLYSGSLANEIATDLANLGSPLSLEDMETYYASQHSALCLEHSMGRIYNTRPPTQGLMSLIILAILDRLNIGKYQPESADYIHFIVEATKQAFLVRDRFITDPAYMSIDPQACLTDEFLLPYVKAIKRKCALPWPPGKQPSDTIWMGVIDSQGCAVSFIQSIYHEFGSGIVLKKSGINWQNRGCSFSLQNGDLNFLMPGRKPFHTLNPALARLNDGRLMIYGTMGGDGQPQTQAAIFTRYVVYNQPLQQTITSPRWLLGRTWGQETDTLKLENRFSAAVVNDLLARNHKIEMLEAYDESVGHAGAIVRYPSGILQGGFDPRSNGGVASF